MIQTQSSFKRKISQQHLMSAEQSQGNKNTGRQNPMLYDSQLAEANKIIAEKQGDSGSIQEPQRGEGSPSNNKFCQDDEFLHWDEVF